MRMFSEFFAQLRAKRKRIHWGDVALLAVLFTFVPLLPEPVRLALIAGLAVHVLMAYVLFRWRQIRAPDENDE